MSDPATAPDWMRAPTCPFNATDCRITIVQPIDTALLPPVVDGTGDPVPPVMLTTPSKGSCTVCNLEWDITRGPLGPNELPPDPYVPPVIPMPA